VGELEQEGAAGAQERRRLPVDQPRHRARAEHACRRTRGGRAGDRQLPLQVVGRHRAGRAVRMGSRRYLEHPVESRMHVRFAGQERRAGLTVPAALASVPGRC
jgi:hypothetical protein